MKYLTAFLIFIQLLGQSQNLKKELPSKKLGLFGQLNSNSILIVKTQIDSCDYFVNFTPTNKIVLTSRKTQLIDSSFNYRINNKNSLTVYRVTKDSSTFITYIGSQNSFRDIEISLCSTSKVHTIKRNTDTVSFISPANANNNNLTLYKRNKTRDILRNDDIFIHFDTISNEAKFSKVRIRGNYYKFQNDTLFVDEEGTASDYHSTTGRDTIPKNLTKIKISNITKMSHERESSNAITGVCIGLSIISTLIVSPLVSLNKSGFNGNRYLKVAGVSLASTIFFTTLRITFSHKRMKIGNKSSNWKFQ